MMVRSKLSNLEAVGQKLHFSAVSGYRKTGKRAYIDAKLNNVVQDTNKPFRKRYEANATARYELN